MNRYFPYFEHADITVDDDLMYEVTDVTTGEVLYVGDSRAEALEIAEENEMMLGDDADDYDY